MSKQTFKYLKYVYIVVDWFIPSWMKQDTDLAPRARMFVISHLFGPILGHPITISLFVMDSDPYPHVPILGLSISLFWLFPWVLKYTGRYHGLAIASVQNLIFATLWGCFFYGGVSSPFMPWLLMVPLLGFYYLGAALRFRVTIIGLISLSLLGFYAAYKVVGVFPVHIQLVDFVGVGMVSIFCAAIYVSMMAVYYANIVASESDLQREIHRHRVTLAELQVARDDAVQANNAKSDFLARMSHELRTPLNAVIGYSEILLEDAELEGQGEQIADLEKINSAGMHLLSMVNDVLDLSKIEAGKTEIYAEEFDIRAFIDDVAHTCRPIVAKGANQLVVKHGPGLGKITSDMTKLRQAVINLLSNAGKFTNNGRIILETKMVDGEFVTVSVEDTGIGIRASELPRLFQNFGQADPSISQKFGGSGLGLALSQKLCRLMGGDITVESEYGKGACFTIKLPLAIPESEVMPEPTRNAAAQAFGLDRSTIVVIDNDKASLERISEILTEEGHKVVLSDNVEDGLHIARLTRPSAIILDAGDMEALTSATADGAISNCPIIIHGENKLLEEQYASQIDGVLGKPINRDQLTRLLAEVASRTEEAPSGHGPLPFIGASDEVKGAESSQRI